MPTYDDDHILSYEELSALLREREQEPAAIKRDIRFGLSTLFDEGDIFEMRFQTKSGEIQRGFYDKPAKLAFDIRRLSADINVKAIWCVLNSLNPAIAERADVKLNTFGPGTASGDADVVRRRWLLIDADPERPSGVSSTAEEKDHAEALSEDIRDYLTSKGWPEPVRSDSGNGFHLLYRLDLPNDAASNSLVNGCLKALHGKFSNAHAKVDVKVGNAARVCKAYGSMSRKGSDTLDRPWRQSHIITAPGEQIEVSPEQLKALAGTLQPPPQGVNRKLRDDFDVLDFASHYDLDVVNPDGRMVNGLRCFYLRSCPIKGAPHSDLTKSALTLGSTLGFSCLSASCCQEDGSKHTINSLRRFLHRIHKPYPGGIMAPLSERELQAWGLDEDDLESEEQATAASSTVTPPAGGEDFNEMAAEMAAEGASWRSMYGPFNLNFKRHAVSTFALDMPEDCMYGWLREAAYTLDTPLGWGYASLMTLFAAQGVNLDLDEDESPVRPTLFTCLLGGAGGGKSTTAHRAERTLTLEGCVAKFTPGSEKGIFKKFGQLVPKKLPNEPQREPDLQSHVIFADEFKELMMKASIQGSALPTTLCTLFGSDEAEAADKATHLKMRARISILGCLKADDSTEFAEYFGGNTTAGLYDRFLFIPGPTDWTTKGKWKPQKRLRTPVTVIGFDEAIAMKDEWIDARKHPSNRVGELALRVATVTASANGETVISRLCMEAALRFADWQEKVRATYAAGIAQNPDAVVAAAILDAFESNRDQAGKSDWMRFSVLHRNKNWSRKFGSSVTRVRKSLVEEGSLLEEREEMNDRNGDATGKTTPTGRYKLPG